MNNISIDLLAGIFGFLSVFSRSVAEGVNQFWSDRVTYTDVRHLKVPDDVDSNRHLRDCNLVAALRWAFMKCLSIDSLTVAETFQVGSDVLRLPIYQQLRRIRLTGDYCVDYAMHCRFVRALSGLDQTDLTELEFGGTSINTRYCIGQNLVRALVCRHAVTLRLLNVHGFCWDIHDPHTVDFRLPALRHFVCIDRSWPTDFLADSVELLSVKAHELRQLFHWLQLIEMEFYFCPFLVEWGPGLLFPSLQTMTFHCPLYFQVEEMTEICRRAPCLSALSLFIMRFR